MPSGKIRYDAGFLIVTFARALGIVRTRIPSNTSPGSRASQGPFAFEVAAADGQPIKVKTILHLLNRKETVEKNVKVPKAL